MTNVKPQSKWAVFKKLLLALPFLFVLAAAMPEAKADDHYGRARGEFDHGRRGRDFRRHGRGPRGRYYHNGRYYNGRRYYYRGGRRYYRYYDVVPGGVSVNIGL